MSIPYDFSVQSLSRGFQNSFNYFCIFLTSLETITRINVNLSSVVTTTAGMGMHQFHLKESFLVYFEDRTHLNIFSQSLDCLISNGRCLAGAMLTKLIQYRRGQSRDCMSICRHFLINSTLFDIVPYRRMNCNRETKGGFEFCNFRIKNVKLFIGDIDYLSGVKVLVNQITKIYTKSKTGKMNDDINQ